MKRALLALALAGIALGGCVTSGLNDPAGRALEKELGMRIAAYGVARSLPDVAPSVATGGCAMFDEDGRTCLRAFTADDPVRIASISKLVTLIGAMRLVEAGTLDLDADVSRYLGFTLRNPAFPDAPVTLRQIFSHTSGLRDGDDIVVPLGTSLREAMARGDHWDAVHAPGEYFTYSNFGIVVAATAMEGASRERFDRLMSRLVFAPLGLSASYNWSGASAATAARVAIPYRTSGDDGVWHADGPWIAQADDRGGALPDCVAPSVPAGMACKLDVLPPGSNAGIFSPHGGLRISLNDLVVLGRLLADGGMAKGVRLLKPETIAAFARPVWVLSFDGLNGKFGQGEMCSYGTGMHLLRASRSAFCKDDLFGDGRARFGHSAEAYGLLGGLWIDPGTREVVVYFASGTSRDPLLERGASGFTSLEEALARTALAR